MGYDETENKLVPLIEVQNPFELEMLQDLLHQENIFTVIRENGSIGNYMKITMGHSVLGETLYVRQRDYFRSRELLQALQQNGEEAISMHSPRLSAMQMLLNNMKKYRVQRIPTANRINRWNLFFFY